MPGTAELDLWVIEISSHQATDLWSSPAVVAVTSLHPDHLTWHGSVERYYADKLALCGRPGARVTVANGDGRAAAGPRRRAAARPPLGRPPPTPSGRGWTEALGLRGRHNQPTP